MTNSTTIRFPSVDEIEEIIKKHHIVDNCGKFISYMDITSIFEEAKSIDGLLNMVEQEIDSIGTMGKRNHYYDKRMNALIVFHFWDRECMLNQIYAGVYDGKETTYTFNNQLETRGREVHGVLVDQFSQVRDVYKAERMGNCKMYKVSSEKNGKWSYTKYKVVTHASLVEICRPFDGFSDIMSINIEYVRNTQRQEPKCELTNSQCKAILKHIYKDEYDKWLDDLTE